MATVIVDKTTVGAWSYTVPYDCIVKITGIGGGGGGAGGVGLARGGGGGGGGALAETIIVAIAGDVITGTIGTGGGGSAFGSNAAGSNGGATTAIRSGTTIISAAPGTGGPASTAGGAGGTVAASTGQARMAGGNGGTSASGSAGVGGAAATTATLTGGATSTTVGKTPGGGGAGGVNTAGTNGSAGAIGALRLTVDELVAPVTGRGAVSFGAGGGGWIAPATGKVLFQAVGGGGGGAGGVGLNTGGAGGGGGAYAHKIVSVVRGDSFNMTTGSGGTAGTYGGGTLPGVGADSVISKGATELVRAKGGGAPTATATPGAGGSAANSVGDVKYPGYTGTAPPANSVFNQGTGGPAGRPIGGGPSGDGSQGPGIVGTSPGGGGSGGGQTTGSNGGAGAAGVTVVAYVSTPGFVVVNGVRKPITAISSINAGVRRPLKVSRIAAGAKAPMQRLAEDALAGLKANPVWLDVEDRPLFSRDSGRFNWTVGAANLRAALTAGTCDIIGVGDSLMEGFTYLNSLPPFDSTVDRANAFPIKMRDRLVAGWPITQGGSGVVRPYGGVGSDPRWSHSGGSGGGHVRGMDGTSTSTFTSTNVGTVVAVNYIDAAATIDIAVDGATSGPNRFTEVGTGTGALRRKVFTGLSNATHSVLIKPTAGTILVVGAAVGTPTGIRFHNLGQGGSTVAGTGQGAWQDTSSGNSNMLPVYSQQGGLIGRNADAVFIMLGGNDLGGSGTKPYAAMETAIRKIGDAFDTATTDIILLTEPHGSINFASPAGYSNEWYGRQMDICVEKGWAMLDTEWMTGGFEYLAGLGYTGDIYGHFNNAGALYVGDLLGNAILSST